ncbi:MAG: hypothetical protein APR62_11735 [Smithella sp. SDB]|nr:MAG: hypothetical protein APR62_11735 [Smithella sp. SDB]
MIKNTRQNKNQRGFTMVEVITVLLIIALLAVVAIVRLSGTSSYDLATQTEVIKAHLRLAQAYAMKLNSLWGINFDSSTTYYLFQGSGSTMPVRIPGENEITVSMTTKKSTLTITSAPQRMTFNSYGSPVDDSGNLMTSNITIVTNGGNITVTKNTGFIP